MIRHIVFFTAKDGQDVDAICKGLELLGTIPHSQHFEVSRNSKVDQISNEVDVVVYAEFAELIFNYRDFASVRLREDVI